MARLPSWVPDWSQPFTTEPFLHQANLVRTVVANCCGPTQPVIRFSDDGESVSIAGLIFDKISSVGLLLCVPRRLSARLWWYAKVCIVGYLKMFSDWERLVSRMEAYPTGEDVPDAFCRTILGNLDIGASPTGVYNFIRGSFLGIPFEARGCTDEDCEAQIRFLEAVNTVAYGRRFFITSKGYMGLGPATAQAGDDVAMFSGGKTAYVLHALKGARFRFEGEAYVHGVMNGEAFQGNPQTREFVLV